jgi:hypothetical protein
LPINKLILFFLYSRCTRYTNIPAHCFLEKDASNPCCKKPQCTSNNTPGTVTGFPTPFGQTVSPPRNPNTPTPAPVMKGKHKKLVRHYVTTNLSELNISELFKHLADV